MAQFTKPSDAQWQNIAQAFGLGTIQSWSSIAAGTVNSNYRIDTSQGTFFVRISEGKTKQDVERECRLLHHLSQPMSQATVPIVEPLSPGCIQTDGLTVVCFPWQQGTHTYAITDRQAEALGKAVGLFHVATRHWNTEVWKTVGDVDRKEIARIGDLCTDLPQASTLIEHELDWQAEHSDTGFVEQGIIHGDIFPDNVFFVGDTVTLLDFEQAHFAPLVKDLAVVLCSFCFDETSSLFVLPRWRSFVCGYQSEARPQKVPVLRLYQICRWVALRFLATRVRDVALRKIDKPDKDYRLFCHRLRALQEISPGSLWPVSD